MKRPEYAKHLQLYAWAARHCYGKKVIDFGSGTGHGLQIVSHFAKEVLGCDNSPHDTNIANNLRLGCNGSFILADVESEAFNPKDYDVDTVLAFEFLEHIKNPHAFVKKIAHLPLICSVPHDYPHRLHLTNYKSINDVTDLLCPYYSIVTIHLWVDGSFVSPDSKKVERYVAVCTPKTLTE